MEKKVAFTVKELEPIQMDLMTKKLPKRIQARKRFVRSYFAKSIGNESTKFQDILNRDQEQLLTRAHLLLSLSEKLNPAIIKAPAPFFKGETVSYRIDKMATGKAQLRYNQSQYSILFLGRKRLYYYQAHMDHQTGFVNNELAGEFCYSDVIDFQVEQYYQANNTDYTLVMKLHFSLISGEKRTVLLRQQPLFEQFKQEKLIDDSVNELVKTIKNNVRNVR